METNTNGISLRHMHKCGSDVHLLIPVLTELLPHYDNVKNVQDSNEELDINKHYGCCFTI